MGSLLFNRKGSSEIIALVLILPLFLFPIWSGFNMFTELYRYDVLKQTARLALLKMESQGGLTPADYDSLVSYLVGKGLSVGDITIDYTPYPVNYGEDVMISISYGYTKIRFNLTVTGLEKTEEVAVMVCGPIKSTSKHYER